MGHNKTPERYKVASGGNQTVHLAEEEGHTSAAIILLLNPTYLC